MNKIKVVILIVALAVSSTLFAQEFRMKVTGNKTLKIIEVNKVEIESHDGSEIIFSREIKKNRHEERAKGLTAISGLGLTDNTGIGLSVKETGNNIEVQQLSRRSSSRTFIKVPKNVKVFYEYTGTGSYNSSGSGGGSFRAINISSELEVSTVHGGMWLENVTGPMTLNSVHGKIEVIFASVNQSSPTSILSVHGLVDVSLPADTKANLKMESHWGELLTDMDIEFEKSDGEMRKHSSNVKGKLNGGGVEFHVASNHGNVYLRKRK